MHRDPDMVEIERIICARADVLVATSEPVASHLGKLSPREVHIITNGADFEHFTANPPARGRHRYSLPGKREDRAVYVGSFDRRFDGEMLRQAARTLADKQFILVGPGGRSIAAALSTPNITSPGAIDYAELPQLLSQCAVGLLPMSSDPANDGRSPMKLYEYVAAGLSIAATSTVELRRHSLATLCLSGKGTPFATAVSQAFDRARDLSLLNAARAAASNEDWAIKADTLLELVGRGD
jgi:teichuronic acid biosynthesis glycosyltransferase TuaH